MQLLNRSEMNKIMAGSEYCGNVYCQIGGVQTLMGEYGCNPKDPT